VLDARVLPGGHEAREIGGIGEEGEDLLDRVAQTLFRLEVETHGFACECNGTVLADVDEVKGFRKNDGVPKDAILGLGECGAMDR